MDTFQAPRMVQIASGADCLDAPHSLNTPSTTDMGASQCGRAPSQAFSLVEMGDNWFKVGTRAFL